MHDFSTRPDEPRKQSVSLESLLFAATFTTAAYLYLILKQPIAAMILPCLHGGWKTFSTGMWLLTCDPRRSRAWISFAFYVAAACWKSAAAAFATLLLFILAQEITGVAPNMDELGLTMLVLLGGVVFNTLIGLGATCAALVHGTRVWVHPNLRRAVRGDFRLLAGLGAMASGLNHAIFVVVTAMMFPLMGGCTLGLVIMAIAGKDKENVMAMIAALLGIFIGPIALIPCYGWVSSRIIARSPKECWPGESLESTRFPPWSDEFK